MTHRLEVPRPFDAVAHGDAEPLIQSCSDELAVLELELANALAEVDEAERRCRSLGIDPRRGVGPDDRWEQLRDHALAEAHAYARHVTMQAGATAADLIERARTHVAVLRGEPPLTTGFVGAPMAPPPSPSAAGWVFVPAGAAPHDLVVQDEDEFEDERDRVPYARTLSLLQVISWSILVAAVLIVGLAWFA